MIYESAILSWLACTAGKLGNYFSFSVIVSFFGRAALLLKEAASSSKVCNFIGREGYLSRAWYNSLIYRFIQACLELPSRLLKSLYAKLQGTFEASAGFRILSAAAGKTHLFLGLLLGIMIIAPQNYWDNRYSTIGIALVLLLFLVKVMTSAKAGFYLKAVDLFLFIFVVSVLLADVLSLYPGLSLRFLAFYLTCFLTVLLIVSSINEKKELKEFLLILLAALFIIGLYGVYQGIKGVPVDASQIDLNYNEGIPGRVFSTHENSNNFAEILIMLLPFAAGLFLSFKKTVGKLAMLVIFAVPFAALLMTYSRSSWMGFAVAAVVFIFFVNKKLIPLFIIIGALFLPFLPASIYKRVGNMFNFQDSSTLYRFDIYRTVWQVIRDYWVTGIGLGTDILRKVLQNYYHFTKDFPVHSHDLYLQIWIETGIVGILSFFGFILGLLKRSIKSLGGLKDKFLKNTIISGAAALAGILVASLVEYIWFYPRTMMIFWILIGLLLVSVKLAAREKEDAQQ